MLIFLRHFLCVAFFLMSSSAAHAEAQVIGPLDLVARINGVDIPFGARGVADVTSHGGQFNLDGEITIYASPSGLQEQIDKIVKPLLPYHIPTNKCTVRLLKLSSLDIGVQDFEARVAATATLSLACGGFVNQERDVPLKIALAPILKDKQSIGWKVLRQPEIELPFTWWAALEIGGTDPQKEFKTALEIFLDARASPKIPSLDGVSAAFKGANFDGNTQGSAKGQAKGNVNLPKEISLRVKGDIHASGAAATKLISQFVNVPELNVSFSLP